MDRAYFDGETVSYFHFRQQVELAHPPGWLLEYQPAVADRGWSLWYTTAEAAEAALAKIAQREGRAQSGRRYLDVTVPGCCESRYLVHETPGRAVDARWG